MTGASQVKSEKSGLSCFRPGNKRETLELCELWKPGYRAIYLKTVQYLMGSGKEKQLFFAVCEPCSISDKKKKQVRNWATEHLAYATQMEPLYSWMLIIRQVQVGVQALDEQRELRESFKSLTSKDSVYIAIHVRT